MDRARQALADKRNPRRQSANKLPQFAPPPRRNNAQTQDTQEPQAVGMRMTPSVVNLTKPELYDMYGSSSDPEDSEEEESDNIYNNLSEGLVRSTSHHIEVEEDQAKHLPESSLAQTLSSSFFKVFLCCVLLSIAGNLMFYFGEQLYRANPVLPDISQFRTLYFFRDLLATKDEGPDSLRIQIVGNSLESISVGFASFLLSRVISTILPGFLSKKKPTPDDAQSPPAKKNRHFLGAVYDSNLIKSLVCAVGLAYCFKKYHWTSKLEVSSLWALANVLIWNVVGSTIPGFISSAIIAISAVAMDCVRTGLTVSLSDYDSIADVLWIGSFVFIGQIIFNKIIQLVYF